MIIDEITYEHRQANFMEAKLQSMKLLGMLKGCIKTEAEHVNIDVGAVLANAGSPEMQSVETFVMKYLTVTDPAGNPVLLNNPSAFNRHFNEYRSHYFRLIIDGVKFHFADFLPAGVASAVNMPSLAALTA